MRTASFVFWATGGSLTPHLQSIPTLRFKPVAASSWPWLILKYSHKPNTVEIHANTGCYQGAQKLNFVEAMPNLWLTVPNSLFTEYENQRQE